MQMLSPAVIAYALQRNHPDIYQKLQDDISSTLPVGKLSDVMLLLQIVKDFCSFLALDNTNWKKSRSKVCCSFRNDTKRNCRVTELREILLGVILLYYHPERIYQLMPGQIKSGLIKELTKLLNVEKATLSLSANNAITYFKAYKGFHDDVLHIYNQLNLKHNYLQAHGNN